MGAKVKTAQLSIYCCRRRDLAAAAVCGVTASLSLFDF
jgi:hypothetical protein